MNEWRGGSLVYVARSKEEEERGLAEVVVAERRAGLCSNDGECRKPAAVD